MGGLRDQEKAAVEELNALREKSSSKDSDRFQKLLDERKEIRDKISELIASIRELRTKHSEMDDKWYNRDRLEAAAAKEEEKKSAAPDWNAEKIARKLAAMPDTGMTDEELAAQRAKARGGMMTDEEKKARGLLYDTSKARAVREESSSDEEEEGAADFEGGDPFDGL